MAGKPTSTKWGITEIPRRTSRYLGIHGTNNTAVAHVKVDCSVVRVLTCNASCLTVSAEPVRSPRAARTWECTRHFVRQLAKISTADIVVQVCGRLLYEVSHLLIGVLVAHIRNEPGFNVVHD